MTGHLMSFASSWLRGEDFLSCRIWGRFGSGFWCSRSRALLILAYRSLDHALFGCFGGGLQALEVVAMEVFESGGNGSLCESWMALKYKN